MEKTLITHYMRDEKLRQRLNCLTDEIFGFNFEEWFGGGYCEDMYIPYSLIMGDKMAANVSANIMDFSVMGEKKRFIQIGTVMTKESERNKGFGKFLMERVLEEYKDFPIYLFANDKAVGFYKKLGFTPLKQYRYSAEITAKSDSELIKAEPELYLKKYISYIRAAAVNSDLHMYNFGLTTFWTRGMESIYYWEKYDCFVSINIDGETAYVDDIISATPIDIKELINCIGMNINKVVLGFTPTIKDGLILEEYREDDCNLMYIGEELKIIQKNKLLFPVYSHA